MPLRSIRKNQLFDYQLLTKAEQRKNNGFSPNYLITNTKNHCFRHCWPLKPPLPLLSRQSFNILKTFLSSDCRKRNIGVDWVCLSQKLWC
jgi:hypothetical protein